MQLAEDGNIVEPGIGAGVGNHDQAFADEDSAAVGHLFSSLLQRGA
jgi:hypothetical protein